MTPIHYKCGRHIWMPPKPTHFWSQVIVQECLEEKRASSARAAGALGGAEVAEAIELLRQVRGEAEAEIREKTHELRRLRADAANSKLQVRVVARS